MRYYNYQVFEKCMTYLSQWQMRHTDGTVKGFIIARAGLTIWKRDAEFGVETRGTLPSRLAILEERCNPPPPRNPGRNRIRNRIRNPKTDSVKFDLEKNASDDKDFANF